MKCDEELEAYLLFHKELLPNLKEINGVEVGKTAERWIEKNINSVMSRIWQHTSAYRLASAGRVDESSIWYVPDEVGCALCHSDEPNVKMLPFVYSPKNSFEDKDTIAFCVLWNTQDLVKGNVLSRDKLFRIDEQKFRSARLSVWFNTPEEYFKKQIDFYVNGSKANQDF